MKYSIRAAKIEDVFKSAHRLRQADVEELQALGYDTAQDALLVAIAHSELSFVDTVDGSPEAFGGVMSNGMVWCVTTTEYIEDHTRRFLSITKELIEALQQTYPVLWNYVYKKNTKHVRWLKFMNFELLEEVPYGPNKETFIKFTRSNTCVDQ